MKRTLSILALSVILVTVASSTVLAQGVINPTSPEAELMEYIGKLNLPVAAVAITISVVLWRAYSQRNQQFIDYLIDERNHDRVIAAHRVSTTTITDRAGTTFPREVAGQSPQSLMGASLTKQ